MSKMLLFFHFCLLWFALNHVKGQESVEFLTFQDSTQLNQQYFSQDTTASSPCAMVPNHHLKEVSSSVLMAESWIRSHVLAHYPSINITSIVVGQGLLCEKGQENNFSLILPSVKNIHYSLTRWGLHKQIKVSASFSSKCMLQKSEKFRDDLVESHIKPLLSFLQDINSPYFLNLPSHLLNVPDETGILLNFHSKAIQNLGFFKISKKINMIIKKPKKVIKFPSRKLSFIYPFPARPTPLAPASSPIGSPSSAPAYVVKSPLPPLIGKISPPPLSLPFAPEMPPMINPANPPSSAPAYVVKNPLPPLIGKISPPPLSLPFAPEMPPMINPVNPPYGFHLPPRSPSDGGGGPVGGGGPRRKTGLWCVAKPSVPPETLQDALDFACGEGGADCEAISPKGICYYPNTVLAHASYAFNDYWQKTKENGGTCGFGGTAMLIDSDPSYQHCRFSLA